MTRNDKAAELITDADEKRHPFFCTSRGRKRADHGEVSVEPLIGKQSTTICRLAIDGCAANREAADTNCEPRFPGAADCSLKLAILTPGY